MIHSFSVHDVSQSLSEVIIGSGAARALPGMPLRETRAKLAGEKKKKHVEGNRGRKRRETAPLFSPDNAALLGNKSFGGRRGSSRCHFR